MVGAGGQLGRALGATAPEKVTAVALNRAQLDVTDRAAVAAALVEFKPDLLVNAAAYTAVDKAESEPEAAYRGNRDAPATLAAAAREAGARLLHVSTDFVFDGCAGAPYAPDTPTAPLGVYGASKLAGEEAVRDLLPNALVVRTAWVYSADGANFVRTMLRLMRERPEVRVVADQVGTPTHAQSLARALWALAESGATGTLHYTDAGVASWYDLAVAVQEEARASGLLDRAVPVIPIRTKDFPTPARRPSYSVLDATAAWRQLGQPPAHWRQELRSMLSALRD